MQLVQEHVAVYGYIVVFGTRVIVNIANTAIKIFSETTTCLSLHNPEVNRILAFIYNMHHVIWPRLCENQRNSSGKKLSTMVVKQKALEKKIVNGAQNIHYQPPF